MGPLQIQLSTFAGPAERIEPHVLAFEFCPPAGRHVPGRLQNRLRESRGTRTVQPFHRPDGFHCLYPRHQRRWPAGVAFAQNNPADVMEPTGRFVERQRAAGNVYGGRGRRKFPRRTTKFYSLGRWTPDDKLFPRVSVSGQKDADGDVNVDTLVLRHPAGAVQIRLTLGGTNGALPAMKFLGLSFCNTRVAPEKLPPNRAAWGKIIPVVERSQQSYPGGNGWCSPTSLSMVLAYWGGESNRADWNLDAPEVAAGVIDHHFKKATGTGRSTPHSRAASTGCAPTPRASTTFRNLKNSIAAGIPVVISARYDLLKDGRAPDFNGHLTVCRGFTENGDLVINDPWTDLKVESVRHIYKRKNVRRAWATSHNTVYLVYPETINPPPDRFGHWFVENQ